MPESQIKATLVDSMGNDLTVVNAARVSFGKKSSYEEDNMGVWHLPDRDVKLIKYLAEHKHFSPFGHCFASFHTKAPVFVRAQLAKHEYLRINEISRRYVDYDPELYSPDFWRGRSPDKKQGSSGEVDYGVLTDYYETCIFQYKDMIEFGVAPEQARMVLPQSMMTEWYWSGSLDAFANMCNLRLKEDTQYETRLVAQQISKALKSKFPHSWKALVKHD